MYQCHAPCPTYALADSTVRIACARAFFTGYTWTGSRKKACGKVSKRAAPKACIAGAYVDGGVGACATVLQGSSWHQQPCCSPVHHAALRALPSLTSTSDIRAHDGRRLVGVALKRRGPCPFLASHDRKGTMAHTETSCLRTRSGAMALFFCCTHATRSSSTSVLNSFLPSRIRKIFTSSCRAWGMYAVT